MASGMGGSGRAVPWLVGAGLALAGCHGFREPSRTADDGGEGDGSSGNRFAFIITTGPAEEVGPTSARLTAAVDPGTAVTELWFEWGIWEGFAVELDRATPRQSLAPGTGVVGVTADIDGLTPATAYAFRPRAENIGGPGIGAVVTFTTDSPAP